jgi:hypothetical protein
VRPRHVCTIDGAKGAKKHRRDGDEGVIEDLAGMGAAESSFAS